MKYKVNDNAFIKTFCYIMIGVAVLGIAWVFVVGFPMIANSSGLVGATP